MTQKVQLVKGKRDAIVDVASIAIFAGVVYFAMNPDKFDGITESFNARVGSLTHWLSVWQTKLSIRSLPQTDDQ